MRGTVALRSYIRFFFRPTARDQFNSPGFLTVQKKSTDDSDHFVAFDLFQIVMNTWSTLQFYELWIYEKKIAISLVLQKDNAADTISTKCKMNVRSLVYSGHGFFFSISILNCFGYFNLFDITPNYYYEISSIVRLIVLRVFKLKVFGYHVWK